MTYLITLITDNDNLIKHDHTQSLMIAPDHLPYVNDMTIKYTMCDNQL